MEKTSPDNKRKTKNFQVRVPETITNGLDVCADNEMISRNALIVRILRDYLNNNFKEVNQKKMF